MYVCVANGEKSIVIWDTPLQDGTAHMFAYAYSEAISMSDSSHCVCTK